MQGRRADVLAMGLFAMAVGSLTLGLAHIVQASTQDHIGIAVIVFLSGGLGPFLTGIALTRHHESLCGFGLTAYGLFWLAVCTAQLVSVSTDFQLRPVLYRQLNVAYFVCWGVMAYRTAYRSVTRCVLVCVIAVTCFFTVLASLNLLTETHLGFGHIVVGLMALYYAVGSVMLAFTGHELAPLGPPLLSRRVRVIRTGL